MKVVNRSRDFSEMRRDLLPAELSREEVGSVVERDGQPFRIVRRLTWGGPDRYIEQTDLRVVAAGDDRDGLVHRAEAQRKRVGWSCWSPTDLALGTLLFGTSLEEKVLEWHERDWVSPSVAAIRAAVLEASGPSD